MRLLLSRNKAAFDHYWIYMTKWKFLEWKSVEDYLESDVYGELWRSSGTLWRSLEICEGICVYVEEIGHCERL